MLPITILGIEECTRDNLEISVERLGKGTRMIYARTRRRYTSLASPPFTFKAIFNPDGAIAIGTPEHASDLESTPRLKYIMAGWVQRQYTPTGKSGCPLDHRDSKKMVTSKPLFFQETTSTANRQRGPPQSRLTQHQCTLGQELQDL
jgi:hypothetical protein